MNTEHNQLTYRTAFFIVSDLVNQGLLGSQVSANEWQLKASVLGYGANTSFKSKEELVQEIAQAYALKVGADANLRIAS